MSIQYARRRSDRKISTYKEACYIEAMTYLFGAELLWCRKVHAIVVPKVIVGYNRGWLDTSTHQEVHQD